MSRTKGSHNLTKRVQYQCPHCHKKGVTIKLSVSSSNDYYVVACRYCRASVYLYPYHGLEAALRVLYIVGKPRQE
jgi:transcription elongation factor Elf1